MVRNNRFGVILTAIVCSAGALAPAAWCADAATILAETKVTQGLVITVGTTDGGAESQLATAGKGALLVQGLSTDRQVVESARTRIAKEGNYGYATVAFTPSLARLPYNDNLANLVVADLGAPGAPKLEEVVRVTAPFGTSYVRQAGQWKALVKPLPKEMGEWTHFNYGPEGNPQSRDSLVAAPRGVQWISSSLNNGTSATYRMAGGRFFYAATPSLRYNNDMPARTFVGRDAFNGLPLWERAESIAKGPLRPEMERVTVADDKRVIGVLVEGGYARALDAASGKELLVYENGLKTPAPQRGVSVQPPPQLVHVRVQDRLLQGLFADVVSLDPSTGARHWAWKAPEGHNVAWMAAGDGKLFVALSDDKTGTDYSYNNWFWFLSQVVAIDLATGKQAWASAEAKDFSAFGMVYHNGGVFVQHSGIDRALNRDPATRRKSLTSQFGDLVRLHAATGKTVFRKNVGAVEPKDTFWHNQLRVRDDGAFPSFGWTARGFDLLTGKEQPRILDVHGAMTHPIGFCSQVRGTANGQVGGKFVSFLDFRDKSLRFSAIARNNCDVAHFPAYGNIYTGSDGCGCAAYVRGTIALQGYQPLVASPVPDDQRLETGVKAASVATPANAWPTLLGDNTFSARTGSPVAIPAEAKPAFTATVPVPEARGPLGTEWKRANTRLGMITPPVVAGDLMVVAVTDTHEVHGLDSASGAPKWIHRAGGRIDSSPTLWNGLVLFGAADGTVTALRAADGAMAWRFLAAPERRCNVVDGQLESLWPVHGSVLVRKGKAFVVAGRHVLAEGGAHLYRLDALTGAMEAKGLLDNRHTSEAPPTETLYEKQGVIVDALSVNADDTLIGMGPVVIDPDTLAWANLWLVNWGGAYGPKTHDGRPNPFITPKDDFFAGPANIGANTPGLKRFMNNPAVGMINRRASKGASKGQDGYRFMDVHAYETQYKGQRLVRDGTTIYSVNMLKIHRFDHQADWTPVGDVDKRGKAVGTTLPGPKGEVLEGAILAGDRFYTAGDKTVFILDKSGQTQATLTAPARIVMHGLAAANGRLYVAQDSGAITVYGGQ